MEVIRKFIDADSLMSIMTLPEAFKNRRLEIIVFPTDEQVPAEQAKEVQSVVHSLIGSIPYTGLSLHELREERLEKYEAVD